MKAYIIQSKKKIEPFFEDVGEILVKNKKLAVLQKEILLNLNLTPVFIKSISEINDENEHIVLSNEVYFEPELVKEFIIESKKYNCSTVCALKPGVFTLRTISNVQDVKKYSDRIEYKLYYHPQKKLRSQVKPIIFDIDKNFENISLPKHISKDGKYLIPITDKPIIQINHWVNLWAANLYSVLSVAARFNKMPKFKLIVAILKSRSLNKWKIASLLNKIGKGCNIHPTAYIEGSIIGDNITIGAGSIIRESIIGDNAFIGNGVVIETSIIGENSTILNGHILYSVLYPNAFSVTHMISASIIGRDSFMGSNVVLTDFRLDNKTITIIKDNVKIDSENILLGCCLGNNVYLGAGCVIAPGRAIPNNLHISLDKERIVTNISDNEELTGFRLIS